MLALTAEREGFEPSVPFSTLVFKTSAIDQLCHLSIILISREVLYHLFVL